MSQPDLMAATVTVTLPVPGGRYVGSGELPVTFEPDPVPKPPAPPKPPVAAPTVPGVHELRQPAQVKAAYPGVALTREFVAGVQTVPRSLLDKVNAVCRPSWQAGLTPMYSLKLDVAQVVAGRWDGPLTELAQWHTQQPDAYVIPWHEPEDDLTAAQFARMFNKVAAVLRAGNPMIRIVYAAMAYQWSLRSSGDSIGGRTNTSADWRAVDAEYFAADVYSGRSFPLRAILPEHGGFARWHDEVVGDRPYMITERGFETLTDHQFRAEQIDREAEWLATDPVGKQCTGYVFWNTPGTEESKGLLLDDEHGVPALRRLVARLAGLVA